MRKDDLRGGISIKKKSVVCLLLYFNSLKRLKDLEAYIFLHFSISPPALLYRNTPIEQHWGKCYKYMPVYFSRTHKMLS